MGWIDEVPSTRRFDLDDTGCRSFSVTCIFVFLSVYLRFGSLNIILPSVSSRSLVVCSRSIDIGSVAPDVVVPFDVAIRNESEEQISVLGINNSCYTELEDETPVLIPSHGTRSVRMVHRVKGNVGDSIRKSVELVTSWNGPQPRIEITGAVTNPLEPHIAN